MEAELLVSDRNSRGYSQARTHAQQVTIIVVAGYKEMGRSDLKGNIRKGRTISTWIRVFFDPAMPSGARVTSRGEKYLTEWRRVKCAQKLDKTGLFINPKTVLPASCLLRDHSGSFRVPTG